jgi:hypothetical protein
MSNDSSRERYIAGRWDDNSFNVYDRENNGKALSEWGGYMSLDDAQEAARKMNDELNREGGVKQIARS